MTRMYLSINIHTPLAQSNPTPCRLTHHAISSNFETSFTTKRNVTNFKNWRTKISILEKGEQSKIKP